jgi:antagonist of KipI
MLLIHKVSFEARVCLDPLVGYRSIGVNPAAAMDGFAQKTFQVLREQLGEMFLLELNLYRFEGIFLMKSFFIILGSDCDAFLNGEKIFTHKVYEVKTGDNLTMEKNANGRFSYLAVGGQLVLSKSTVCENLTLQRGDGLFYNFAEHQKVQPLMLGREFSSYFYEKKIRFIKGNEWNMLDNDVQNTFLNTPFSVTSDANNMGFRLEGKPIFTKEKVEMISAAVNVGTIQLLPDGQCVVLMSEGQTTGGYPKIGHVISSDMHLLSQKNTNDNVFFEEISIENAEEKIFNTEKLFKQLSKSLNCLLAKNA